MKYSSQIEEIVQKMTLKDKIAFCSGANIWQTKAFPKYGIPAMFMCDGPHGLRKQEIGKNTDMLGLNESCPATCFPAEVTTSASYDKDLLKEIGHAIGEEARTNKVGLVLGPGVNIKRNPLCGRNFEYFSEDPILAGELAAAFIEGVESMNVGTSIKHFACNSQERDRFTSDSIIDERSLREIYLRAFEIAVASQPATIMNAYSKLNGVHCSDNKFLLSDILRDEWKYDGLVVTDWGAMNNRIDAFWAGCDLSMPGGSDYFEKECKQAVENGQLDEEKINQSVRRILSLVFRANENLKEEYGEKLKEHHNLAIKAAEKGIVLLKNEDEALPLSFEKEKIVVIGQMAKNLRIQGSGSSHINPTIVEEPMDFLSSCEYAQGYNEDGSTSESLLTEAADLAKTANKVVVFVGLPNKYESEGFDRDNLKMPDGELRLLEELAKVNKNLVVVLNCGSVVECTWADDVKAILFVGLPGQGGSRAIYNVLSGDANPCGKLSESWVYKYEDVPSSNIFAKTKDALYEEGLYVGYRYYEKEEIPVRWPFGYGLSYTSFKYSDLKVKGQDVSVIVKNTGKLAGEEIVLLYVGREKQGAVHRPLRELKAFKKIYLNPGESKCVEFTLSSRDFGIWQDGWKVEEGKYIVSASDLKKEIEVPGQDLKEDNKNLWYWNVSGKPNTADFETLLGKKYKPSVAKKGEFTMDSTIMEMKDYSPVMKVLYDIAVKVVTKPYGGKVDYSIPEVKMMINASVGGPLRNIQISTGAKGGLFKGLLEMANGHFWRGLWTIISG